ncbi:TPA: hypothetical protein DCL30_02670 [Candidatus Peribacteria bacterium]|nr:hypothetical protein [Candidatus Peribacteria bacterium]
MLPASFAQPRSLNNSRDAFEGFFGVSTGLLPQFLHEESTSQRQFTMLFRHRFLRSGKTFFDGRRVIHLSFNIFLNRLAQS